jgi:threonylcarbamoyladenosine tRNA methylthiotransferase MtaB
MENHRNDNIIDGLTGNYIRVYASGNKVMQGKPYEGPARKALSGR